VRTWADDVYPTECNEGAATPAPLVQSLYWCNPFEEGPGARPKEEPILSPYYAHIGHTRCDERQAISGHKKIPADGLEYW